MKLTKQISGFVVLMGVIFIALQLFSHMAEKGSIPTIQGPKFAPSQNLATSEPEPEPPPANPAEKAVSQVQAPETDQAPKPSQAAGPLPLNMGRKKTPITGYPWPTIP